jgi:carboxyl-terminal processing protease
MPKRNLAWTLVVFLVVLLFWTLPGTLAGRDSLYRAFGPLVAARAQIQKYYYREVDDDVLLNGAIRGMVEQLDEYSSYVPPEEYPEFRDRQTEGVFNGVGIEVDMVDGVPTVVSPIEGTPAFVAGITGGDQILAVDGEPTANMRLLEVVDAVTGESGTSVKLLLRGPSAVEPREVELQRTRITISSVKGASREADGTWNFWLDRERGIGYVRVSTFVESTVPQVRTALRELHENGAAGVVLDLRFNPGGLLQSAVDMVSCFLDDGLIVSIRGRRSDERKWYATPENTITRVPVVVLINYESASASEIVSGALQEHGRAVIVGSRSFGKGSVQNMIELEGHGAIKLTTSYYYLPSGRPIHRQPGATHWGIEPDVVVTLTEEEKEEVKFGRRRAEAMVSNGRPAATTSPAGAPSDEAIVMDRQLEEAVRVLIEKNSPPDPAAATTAEQSPPSAG